MNLNTNSGSAGTGNQITNQRMVEKKPLSKVLLLVTVICWLAIFVEGYDLVVYGVVLPSLMSPSEWGLTPTQAGAMGSYALLGMFLGSSVGGVLTDKFGRKQVLAASLVLLSAMMLLTAVAHSPELFGFYRFVAGLGIGGLIPPATSLTTEYSPPKYRSLVFVLMYSGFAFGGVVASVFGVLFIGGFGWRFLFWLGVMPIILVPVIIKYLPESIKFLKATNQSEKARKIIEKYQLADEFADEEEAHENSGSLASIFSKRYIAPTILLSLIYIMVFLLIYGVNTWLPQIMRQAGYPMNSSLLFLLVFNLSAVVGGIIGGAMADRFPAKKVISFAYLLAAISISLLSVKFNTVVMYALIAVTGFGTTGTTFILASFLMIQYNSHNRATGSGVVTAIGRLGAVAGPILVGIIMSMNAGYQVNFYLFAIVAILASLLILFIPNKTSAE